MIRYLQACAAKAARSASFWLAVLATLSFAGPTSARADITSVGDVSPPNPSTWDSSTYADVGSTAGGTVTVGGGSSLLSGGCTIGPGTNETGVVNVTDSGSSWTITGAYGGAFQVGDFGSGTLSITNGGSVSTYWTYMGWYPGSNGTVIVDGPGSSFTNTRSLVVGDAGNGTLSITNGGSVSVAGTTYLGGAPGSSGTIDFGANGGTLTTNALFGTQVSGTGTINAHGLVSDWNVVLDSTYASQKTITIQQPGKAITVNLDLTTNPSDLGAGWTGAGSLTIKDGITVSSAGGYLGYNSGSTGIALVTGSGSTWATGTGQFFVGNGGSGTLLITNGGRVNNNGYNSSVAVIGQGPGSRGVVTVDGPGSTWTGNGSLLIGNSGSGTLSIINGASISVSGTTFVGSVPGSSGEIDFGANGGTLTTHALFGTQVSGTGTINTHGLITDMDTVLGSTYALQNAVAIQKPGTNVTVNLDLTTGKDAIGAGWTGAGTMTIRDGITVGSYGGYVGYNSGSTGVALVTGTGSAWVVNPNYGSLSPLIIGNSGSGTLSIMGGGSVTYVSGAHSSVGDSLGSTGVVNVDGPGSYFSLNTPYYCVGNGGRGTLSITNGGGVSGGPAYVGNSPGSTGSAKVDGVGSNWRISQGSGSASLVIGNSGSGTLSISNGASVTSGRAYVGESPNSTGLVAVDGNGSVWNCPALFVADSGSGTLTITNGGTANASGSFGWGAIGNSPSSTGLVNVRGPGSKLIVGGAGYYFYVGNSGSGTLTISNGGSVGGATVPSATIGSNTNQPPSEVMVDGAGSVWSGTTFLYVDRGSLVVKNGGSVSLSTTGAIYVDNFTGAPLSIVGGGTLTAGRAVTSSPSVLSIDVGRGSLLSAGTLTRNNGILRLLAAAGVPADGRSYSPISAGGTWADIPYSQPIGGTWNSAAHTFTASSVANGTASLPLSLDLKLVQRALVNDNGPGGTGWTVGASFPAAGSTTNMTFTATPMNQTILDVLRGELPAGESILSGWSFSTTGFTATSSNPVYLSFQVGSGQTSEDLDVWHYDGSAWTQYSALDLTYDGNYASFTASGLSGYAMVAVPEPATLALLLAGAIGLLGGARVQLLACPAVLPAAGRRGFTRAERPSHVPPSTAGQAGSGTRASLR